MAPPRLSPRWPPKDNSRAPARAKPPEGEGGRMRAFMFHLMPWPHLPDDFEQKYDSAWVWFPNSFYDPAEGHGLYNRYLDELELAEPLGFDGVCVNEHHQNAYGLMPSPN